MRSRDRGSTTRRRSESSASLRWTVLSDGPGSGAENMARDHALALERREGQGILRLYRWVVPTVSFGRNQPARGLYDPEVASRLGVAFVRRPTGGRAVLHDRELTYAIVAPPRAWGGLRHAFRRINEGIVNALRSLGVPAELAGQGPRARPPDAEACFREPAAGEITVRGRKIVGSAQVRIGESFLQHGSVLIAGDQELLARVGPASVRGQPAITIQDVVGRVPLDEDLAQRLVAALAESLSGRWEPGSTTSGVEKRARALVERYGSPEWTWRR